MSPPGIQDLRDHFPHVLKAITLLISVTIQHLPCGMSIGGALILHVRIS
jgi:hypothetical protein